jgi:hypothetical protein
MCNVAQTRNGTTGSVVDDLRNRIPAMAKDLYNTWQKFAEAASVEQDSDKLMHLIQQLHRALDEEDGRTPSPLDAALNEPD